VHTGRRDATDWRRERVDAARQLDYNPNLANVKFLPRERVHDARREVPELGGGGAVGRGQREDALILADHLHLPRKVGWQGWRERVLHCANPAHLHVYCYQVLQGIQKEADAPAMPSHGRTLRGGNR
jgi:hypothetical protein